jgi:hypothetical protein
MAVIVTLITLAGSDRQAEPTKPRQIERLSIGQLEAGEIVLRDEKGRR